MLTEERYRPEAPMTADGEKRETVSGNAHKRRERMRGRGGGSCYHWLFENGATYTHRLKNSITGDKWYRPKQTHTLTQNTIIVMTHSQKLINPHPNDVFLLCNEKERGQQQLLWIQCSSFLHTSLRGPA